MAKSQGGTISHKQIGCQYLLPRLTERLHQRRSYIGKKGRRYFKGTPKGSKIATGNQNFRWQARNRKEKIRELRAS